MFSRASCTFNLRSANFISISSPPWDVTLSFVPVAIVVPAVKEAARTVFPLTNLIIVQFFQAFASFFALTLSCDCGSLWLIACYVFSNSVSLSRNVSAKEIIPVNLPSWTTSIVCFAFFFFWGPFKRAAMLVRWAKMCTITNCYSSLPISPTLPCLHGHAWYQFITMGTMNRTLLCLTLLSIFCFTNTWFSLVGCFYFDDSLPFFDSTSTGLGASIPRTPLTPFTVHRTMLWLTFFGLFCLSNA